MKKPLTHKHVACQVTLPCYYMRTCNWCSFSKMSNSTFCRHRRTWTYSGVHNVLIGNRNTQVHTTLPLHMCLTHTYRVIQEDSQLLQLLRGDDQFAITLYGPLQQLLHTRSLHLKGSTSNSLVRSTGWWRLRRWLVLHARNRRYAPHTDIQM